VKDKEDEKTNIDKPDLDQSTIERRHFLSLVGGLSALAFCKDGMAQEAQLREIQRIEAVQIPEIQRAQIGGFNNFTANKRNTPVSQVWNLQAVNKRRMTSRASRLTIGDLQDLGQGKMTERNKDLSWKDLTSILDAVGSQHGFNGKPANFTIGGGVHGGCCCCCTCCCGDCTFSVDCKDAEIKAPE
jgi:hypothetical protein